MKYVNPYKKKRNTGGAVGTVAGAALGSVVPGVGTALGATLGGAAGKIIGGLFGRKKKKEPEPPATVGRTFQASYGFRDGGGIPGTAPSVKIGGRSHEAGGVSLEEFGRPDVEVERNEVVSMDEAGQPEYVYSAMRMNDKPRTFAEEYERLEERGDLEGIKKLQRKQEEQMGRKNNVTIDDTVKRAEFAKTGGNLKSGYKTGGSMYSPKSAAKKYGGRFNKRYGGNFYGNVKRLQTGGPTLPFQRGLGTSMDAGEFRFYDYPGVGPMSSPQYSDLNTVSGPGATTALERMAAGQNAPAGPANLPDMEVTAPGNSAYAAVPGVAPLGSSELPGVDMTPVEGVTAPGGMEAVGDFIEEANIVEETPSAEAAEASGGSSALQIAGKVLPYAADLLNIGIASRSKKPKKPRNITPTLLDTRVSTTADEAALTQSARAITADPTASASQKLAATAQLNQAKGQVRSQANERRTNIQRTNAQLLNRGKEVNQRTQERYQTRKDQHEGAKLTAISGGVRSIADRVERQAYQKQLQELEPLQLTAMLHSMPTERRRAFVQDLMKSLPAGHRLRTQLQGLAGTTAAA